MPALLRLLAWTISALVAATVLPAAAGAVQISQKVEKIAARQVTIGWKTDVDATSELRWDDKRHVAFGDYPTAHDESYVDPSLPSPNPTLAGTIHSRTISYLPSGRYWVMVRSRDAVGNVAEGGPYQIDVATEIDGEANGSGSLARLLINGPVTASTTSGGVTYIAGRFNSVGLRTGSGVTVSMSEDTTRRGDVPRGLPEIEGASVSDPGKGAVLTSTSDGKGGWFIGGRFSKIGGLSRRGLAHILPDGGVDMFFSPGAGGVGPYKAPVDGNDETESGVVYALSFDEINFKANGLRRLYVGGNFNTYAGATEHNIVAVNADTGVKDEGFKTRRTSSGPIGTDGSVHTILADPYEADSSAIEDKYDHSGVFFGGAFNSFRGEPYSKIAHTEMNGDRARYRIEIQTDGSPEWTIIKQLIGSDAAIQDGEFQMDQRAWIKSQNADGSNQVYDPDAVVTSLALYDQRRCATGVVIPPRPNNFLKDIPIIGAIFNLTALLSAVTDPNSPDHKYMTAFMRQRITQAYRPTLIAGGRFYSATRPIYKRDRDGWLILKSNPRYDAFKPITASNFKLMPAEMINPGLPQNGLVGIASPTGTYDLTTSNASMAQLETYFPALGQEIRNDLGQTNGRFSPARIKPGGEITSLAVVDRHSPDPAAECANDEMYIGGNFVADTNSKIRDLAKIDLVTGVSSEWPINAVYNSVNAPVTAEEDAATSITSLQLDDVQDPKTVFASGSFGQSNGNPTAGFAMYKANNPNDSSSRTGAVKTNALRDGADGVVYTISVNHNSRTGSTRAFLGGEFKSYDAFAAPGVVAIKEDSKDPYAKVNVVSEFRPTGRVTGGDITTIAATKSNVFIGGSFDAMTTPTSTGKIVTTRRGGLAAYARGTGASTNIGSVAAQDGANGSVNALEALDDRLFIGGAFSKYIAPSSAVCNCANIVVVNEAGELFGGSGQDYRYAMLGVDGPVKALAVGNDRLYVGGSFHHGGGMYGERGGLLVTKLADGTVDTRFHAVDGGTNGTVNALAVAAGGAVFVGGAFSTYRGTDVGNIAKVGANGQLDGYFHDPEYGSTGANGEITSLQVINDQLFAAGRFSSFDGIDRKGVAAMSTVTGNVVQGFDPKVDGAVNALTTVGDRLVVGGDFSGIDDRDGHGNVGVIGDARADDLAPFVRMTQTGGLPAKGTFSSSNGDVFYGPRSSLAEDPQELVLTMETYDRATFAQFAAKPAGQAIQQIAWPLQAGGATRIAAEQPSGAGIHAACTTPAANPANEAMRFEGAALSISGAASFPATMADASGPAQCRWTSNLLVPQDAGATLALRVRGAGGARAWVGTEATPSAEVLDTMSVQSGVREFGVVTSGREILPFTMDWTGTAPNRDFVLEWKDGNGVWSVVPSAAFAGKTTFSARYRFNVGATGAIKVPVSVLDGNSNPQATDIELKYDDELPVGASFGAIDLPASGISAVPIRLAIGADGGDAAGAGVAGRWIEMQEAPFAASAPFCSGIDPQAAWTKLDARILTANEYTMPHQSERCYSFRLVTVDNVDNVHYDLIGTGAPVAFDRGAPTIGLDPVTSPLEGSEATLAGPLVDTGVGVGSYRITVAGTTSRDLTGCAVTATTWQCPFDTTGASDGVYGVHVWAQDRLDQATPAGASTPIRVDNDGPQVAAASVDLGAAGASAQPNVALDAVANAMPVVWFNPNLPGSFTVNAAFLDDGSGIGSLVEPVLGDGWRVNVVGATRSAAAKMTGTGPAGTPRAISNTYEWARGATAPGVQTFTAFETFGKSSATSFDVRADGDLPTIALEDGAVADGAISVPVELRDATTRVVNAGYVRRIGAMVTPGTCAGAKWSDPSPVVTLDPAAELITDKDLKAGQCYRYGVTAVDRVGNQPEMAEVTNEIRVGDIPAPKLPENVKPVAATPPVPVTPQPTTQPPVLRDKEIADKPTAVAPAPPKPVEIEQAKPDVAAPAVRAIPVDVPKPVAKPKPVLRSAPIPVVEERRASSVPKRAAPKQDDRSWLDKTMDWTKDHKAAVAAAGLAGVHLGGTLLFGKGLGAVLSSLFSHLHLNVPFGAVRRLFVELWKRRSRTEDEGDDEQDDDEDDRWNDVPSTYRPAA